MMVVMVFMLIFFIVMVVMMVMSHMFFFTLAVRLVERFLAHLLKHIVTLLNDLEESLALQFRERGRHDLRCRVERTDQLDIRIDQSLVRYVGTAQNNGTCILHLVIEELAEILHVHLQFLGIDDGHRGIQDNVKIGGSIRHGLHNVGKLADAGRLDDDAFRLKTADHLAQRLLKVAYQRAADASLGHLADLNARIL